MFNNLRTYLFILLFIPYFLYGQDSCTYELRGKILDDNNQPLPHALVSVGQQCQHTQNDGCFKFKCPCTEHNKLSVQLLGYISEKVSLKIQSDTFLQFKLANLEEEIRLIEVVSTPDKNAVSQTLNSEQIQQNATKNLGQQLAALSGVNILKTGNNISKPIVHGLYGNRLNILNNGIPHSGQQWGNDHSPEIDPQASNSIRVITGAASLEYGGVNPGAVILTEAPTISGDKKIKGRAGYFFESNGLGHGLQFGLQQNHPALAWAIQANFQKAGDLSAPDYYLRNTGKTLANFSLQLQKQFSDKFRTGLYFSSYNANIGILRGAHIGNLTDLQQAYDRSIPFFTQQNFTYQVDAPRQLVHHNMLKWNSTYFFNDRQWLKTAVAGQMNWRREYDIRRNSQNTAPAMSILQYNAFVSTTYQHLFEAFAAQWTWKTGVQASFTDNTNIPETGFFPLIPDYQKFRIAAFSSLSMSLKKLSLDLGVRSDNIMQEVLYISTGLPYRVIRDPRTFHNISAIAGVNYQFSPSVELKYAMSYAIRNPEINEMYSNGLHQGVSGIEEGNMNLSAESGLKNTLQFKANIAQKIQITAQAYHQYFDNYIYFQVLPQPRLTIRGAFPVYQYQQSAVQIYGADIDVAYQPLKGLDLRVQYNFLRGSHLSDNRPLVYMPSNRLAASVFYKHPKAIQGKNAQLHNLRVGLENRYVFRQDNLLEEQDFMPAPEAYYLLDFVASVEIKLANSQFDLSLRVENMLNTRYRDYLNRQRYFSDEKGINCILGLQYRF